MNPNPDSGKTRREFLKTTGRIAAASALAGVSIPYVHAAENNTIQIALIGCGGRGSGAAHNALSVSPENGPTKLVAMADVFQSQVDGHYEALKNAKGEQVDVPPERRFVGFDAYKKAMDCLRPGDVAIFTTPLVFRWVHFTYAIQKGLNVFMEKPLTADGPTSRRMLQLGEEASAKNLKVGVGLMSRHARPLQELKKRIEDGQLGEINLLRGYRMASGALASAFSEKWPGKPSELLWQISRFHSFIYLSGGCFNDFYIHHIDHLCWLKGAWPVSAQAIGGRHYRYNYVDQNFDSYSVEYTFEDGARMYMDGRCMNGAFPAYASYVQGSKGMAIAAASGDCNPPSSIFAAQKPQRDKLLWTSKIPPGEGDPYVNEWNELLDAIRNNKPYNEVKHGVYASLTSSLGRKAAHTAQEIKLEELLNSTQEYAPDVDKLTLESPSPLPCGPDGKYPIPQPGILTDREY